MTQRLLRVLCGVSTPGHRELKFARTRLGMLDAFLEFTAQRPFSEISIHEIAARAGVSYATFFNYFHRKEDLLRCQSELWFVELSAAVRSRGGLGGIEEVFRIRAAQCRRWPAAMALTLVCDAGQMPLMQEGPPLTQAEKMLRFPGWMESRAKPESGFRGMFARLLKEAAANGELPRHVDPEPLADQVTAVLLGLPAALGPARAELLESAYASHLSLLWKGIQAAPRQRAKQKRGKLNV